jgi:hypothetical protein
MKRIIIFKVLIFSILCSFLSAQAPYKAMAKIPLSTVWKKGESYQYELIKGKINYFEGKEDSRSEMRQTVTLSVEEASTKGFIMQATYNSAAYFLPEQLKELKGMGELIEKYSQVKVRYGISAKGEFLRILNGSEIQKMMLDLLDVIENAQSLTFNEAAKEVFLNMQCQMTSEVYITEGLFQELRLLHQFYGNEYISDNFQEYDTELANMLEPQGKPIPAKASLKVSWQDDKYCLVEHTLAPDEKIMKKLSFDYFSKMSGGTMEVQNIESQRNPDSIGTEGGSLKVLDEGKYAFHQRSGWLVELYKTRTIDFDLERTVEYVKMAMLEKGSF